MNVHGNDEAADIFGNSAHGIFGESVNANVIGVPPLDVWGHPTGIESGHELFGGVLGDILGGLMDAFFG